ncbi:sugar transferase [Winogradskyella rapida]|uniref:Sugar transferase n=1 Tax=Winogradskyella rapida TaxID=549701 RepID=A0ABW3KP59_9FLAO
MITTPQRYFKRLFDLVIVILSIPFILFPVLLLTLIAMIDTREWGIFSQQRIGQHGLPFKIYKIKTLAVRTGIGGTRENGPSSYGHFLRRSKLNELPQLYNVLKGDMSLVGPRPDLPGFADALKGKDQIILKVKPGLTGLASLKYRHEDDILARQPNPEEYNRTIIWVDKVKINRNYIQNYTFYLDLSILLKSILNQPYTDDKHHG